MAFSIWIAPASHGPSQPQLIGLEKSVMAKATGATKIALGHHLYDFV